MHLLELQNVTAMRGERVALRNLSLSIPEGEHCVILGPNGCGKSTLIKLITREVYPLHRPGSAIRILGKDRWNLFDLRNFLGIVTNDLMAACTREVTGHDLILAGFFGAIEIQPWHEIVPEMEERTGSAMELLEITHLAKRDLNTLSSGEARRFLLARALVHQPRALILDEPTTSLDIHATGELRGAFRKLARAGVTLILVTHHLPDIVPEMQRVLLMKDGTVVADGSKADVLNSGVLSSLFQTPVEVLERGGYFQLWER